MQRPTKTTLTEREKIKAAYLCDVSGVEQHLVAIAFEVQQGRINEALMEIREAIGAGNKSPSEVRDVIKSIKESIEFNA